MTRARLLRTILKLPIPPLREAVEQREIFSRRVCGDEFSPELSCSTETSLLVYHGNIPIEISFLFTPPKVKVFSIDASQRLALWEKTKSWLNEELEGARG